MARRSKQSIEAEQLILQTLKLMDIRVEAISEGSTLTIDFNPSTKKKAKPAVKKATAKPAAKAKPGPKPKAKTATKAKPVPKPKAKTATKAKPGPKPKAKAKAKAKAKTTKAIAKKK